MLIDTKSIHSTKPFSFLPQEGALVSAMTLVVSYASLAVKS